MRAWLGIFESLLGPRPAAYPLTVSPLPIQDLDPPSTLAFFFAGDEQPRFKPSEEVGKGQPLFARGSSTRLPSPVTGKVEAVRPSPDIRGGKAGFVLAIEASEAPSPLAPLDPDKTPREAILARLREAEILCSGLLPSPLWIKLSEEPSTLIVLAADAEPRVSWTSQLLKTHPEDIAQAERMLARASSAKSVRLAFLEPFAREAEKITKTNGLEPLPIPPRYPESLKPLVSLRAGDPNAVIIPLETALAALECVRAGRMQDTKLITVIGHDGEAIGNFRVPIGTTLAHVLQKVGLSLEEGARLVAGGLMRGFAQYSAEAPIDAGIDAIAVLKDSASLPWTDEPCINCGLCIDACPRQLQVQLIGRYSEFGLFDRTADLQIHQCFECGLCASSCTARRPLLQLIRLAKQELAKAAEQGA